MPPERNLAQEVQDSYRYSSQQYNMGQRRLLDEHKQVEEEYIDTLTGEILDKADNAKIVVEDLPNVCHALLGVRYKQQALADYLASKIEHLTAYCSTKSTSLVRQEERLLQIAEGLLVSSGERRLAYPGLGVVRFAKGHESTNTEGWDALDERARIEMSTVNQGAFTIKTTITPKKREIARRLKEGATSTVPLATAFSVVVPPDHFEFKED
ncbi:MAG: hypothetical protein ABIH23_26250 [bacterium]